MLTVEKLELLHSAIFENILESNSFCLSDEAITIIEEVPKSIAVVVALVKSEQPDPSWNLISLCLLHLSCLQNVCQCFSTHEIYGVQLRDKWLRSDILREALFDLVVAKPLILQNTTIATITKVVNALSTSPPVYQEWVDKICHFISTCHDDEFFSAVEIMTKVLTNGKKGDKIPINEMSTKLIHLIQKSSLLIQKDCTVVNFATYLDLLHAIFASNEIPEDTFIASSESVLLNFSNACEHSVITTKYLKVVKRILPLSTDASAGSSCVKQFAARLFSAMVAGIPKSVQHKPGEHGFGGAKKVEAKDSCSSPDVMLMVNILLKCIALTDCGNSLVPEKATICIKILLCANSKNPQQSSLENELLEFYFEQDDLLIEFLLLHLLISTSSAKTPEKPAFCGFSPHQAFLSLVQRLAFDNSILLDWLTSEETQFLLYFIKYIKYCHKTQNDLLAECKRCNATSSLNEMLLKLKKSIERLTATNLFPYSAKPLLKNIDLFLAIVKPV
uniref:Uncharacterized protein LOC100181817 n=1 Tax=Phallusia mammillata TaxID=59560 RepID=A0A6F9DGZ3_9ASCI|nr:uncharacterized protein LOC100181817 [Phallusia mammillata]